MNAKDLRAALFDDTQLNRESREAMIQGFSVLRAFIEGHAHTRKARIFGTRAGLLDVAKLLREYDVEARRE